jgi:DNA-binding IclR family transcriptional regulator
LKKRLPVQGGLFLAPVKMTFPPQSMQSGGVLNPLANNVTDKKINRTVKRAIDILQQIKDNDALTIKELSRLMKIPTSSAFDIVHTLYAEKFLEYNTSGAKAFSIGVRAFELGSAYRQHTNLIKVIHPYVEKLMRLSNATSFLAVADDTEIIYLDKVEAETSIRTSAELGSRRDMYSTGLGKAVMMYYPEEKIRSILAAHKPAAHTEHTITGIEPFLEEIKQSRRRGYAVDNRESNINVFCIAHAIFDSYGNPFGAISIATMYSSINESSIKQYGKILKEYAGEISKKLGYLGSVFSE